MFQETVRRKILVNDFLLQNLPIGVCSIKGSPTIQYNEQLIIPNHWWSFHEF